MNSNAQFGVISGSLAKVGHELHYATYDLSLIHIFDKYDYNIITEKDKANEGLKEKYGKKLYFLPYGTRAKLFTYISVSYTHLDVYKRQ